MSQVYVVKADGSRQPYQRKKIIDLCLRMHAPPEVAEKIADKVEERLYDGIETERILRMVFRYLRRYKPAVKYQIDLRKAISLLRPKPDFERFVQLLLREYGYRVLPNMIVRGRCVEHEIDAIAIKGNETILVEVKHHFNHHTYTGLDVCREIRATYEDLTEGYSLGLNEFNITRAMVISNTKFSNHAKQYADCRGIVCMGWKAPSEQGLETMIEKKRFYPITLLKSLRKEDEKRLGDNGVVLLKQLVTYNFKDLLQRTNVPKDRLERLLREAREILTNL